MHHAFAIEAGQEEGVEMALGWATENLGMSVAGNPDVVVLRYGLLGVEEARNLADIALQAAIAGEHKVIIVAANRAYREAQNALLKLFEEPPAGTYLFLILPTLGGLLPTLRSRIHVLAGNVGYAISHIPEAAAEFLRGTRDKRSAMVKKLVAGKDEEERREHRDEALAIVNGIEAAAYAQATPWGHASKASPQELRALLEEIQTLRGYLHERSAPVRMILEHLAIVTPRGLV